MKKNIAIDCRFLGLSGIGRYLEGILENLDFEQNNFTLVGKKEQLDKWSLPFTPVHVEESPFSLKGMFKFPSKEVNACDVFFTPNFLVPYGIKCKIYSTIHDVVFLDIKECNNGVLDYRTKKHFLKRALKRSEKVFTVSKFSLKRIDYHFSNYLNKLIVLGNSVAKIFLEYDLSSVVKESILLYVGNIKKHKGLVTLLNAYDKVKQETGYKLYIVGNAENFVTTDTQIANRLKNDDIVFLQGLNQQELLNNIAKAKFLIQPSLYEGFGLPPLEALALGTKPILSDIEVFKEIYSDFDVEFFESQNVESLASAIVNTNPITSTTKNDILQKFDYKSIADRLLAEIAGGKLK